MDYDVLYAFGMVQTVGLARLRDKSDAKKALLR